MPPARKATKRTAAKARPRKESEAQAASEAEPEVEAQAAPEPDQDEAMTMVQTGLRFSDADGAQGPGSRGFLLTKPLTGPAIDAALAARTGQQPPLGVVILQDPAAAAPDHALVMWVISTAPSDEDIEAVLNDLEPEGQS